MCSPAQVYHLTNRTSGILYQGTALQMENYMHIKTLFIVQAVTILIISIVCKLSSSAQYSANYHKKDTKWMQVEPIRCSSVHMQIITTFKSHILTDPALHPDASRAADSENSRQVIGAEWPSKLWTWLTQPLLTGVSLSMGCPAWTIHRWTTPQSFDPLNGNNQYTSKQ